MGEGCQNLPESRRKAWGVLVVKYYDFQSVRASALLIEWTRNVVKEAPNLGGDIQVISDLDVDARGDVDDDGRLPIVFAQVTSGQPLDNGPYGAAIRFNALWIVLAEDGDQGQEVASALQDGLMRYWLRSKPLTEGSLSHVDFSGIPTPRAVLGDTADTIQYGFTGTMVARSINLLGG